MADDADRAEERIEEVAADALAEVRRALFHGLPITGACHYCGEPLDSPRRFCDADCRNAWDHETRLRRMQGVA